MSIFSFYKDGLIFGAAEAASKEAFTKNMHRVNFIDRDVIEIDKIYPNNTVYDRETGKTVLPPPPEMTSVELTKIEFMDLAFSALGGVERFGDIIKQARASNDNGVVAVFERYLQATTFLKSEVSKFLMFLVDAEDVDVTEKERNQILKAWPEVEKV